MKQFKIIFFLLLLQYVVSAQNEKPNVLFIAVDDLRPELGCYGQEHIKSPHIDKLASEGLIFNRAYCNIPVCGASRASLLSGIRPNRNRFLDYKTWQDKDVPGAVSLPMHFKNNGYSTVSLGKIYHHFTDGKGSWNTQWMPNPKVCKTWRDYLTEENNKLDTGNRSRGKPFEKADANDDDYKDGMIAKRAIEELRRFKENKNPFFLAVGFLKPHLPFNAPSKYWDMYDSKEIKLPPNMNQPENAPDECMHTFGELRAYNSIPKVGDVSKSVALKMIHGYYACVSYTDAQIGRVLDELKSLGLDKNTIIILWGDHGWHLGEHNLWCKHCNFEKVLHTPLIIKAPGKKQNIKTNALVEYVDIYPSLCELAGLDAPFHLQGKSFVPLTENPELPWKQEVYCRWIKGETLVTMSHTYTEWLNDNTGEVDARMMYDLTNDPEETVNIAEEEHYKKLVQELSEKLKKHISERDKLIIP